MVYMFNHWLSKYYVNDFNWDTFPQRLHCDQTWTGRKPPEFSAPEEVGDETEAGQSPGLQVYDSSRGLEVSWSDSIFPENCRGTACSPG